MPAQTTSVGMERKLAAIFSTDVAGRVVGAPGDNLLAEFASVVDAVRCAVEIQHALTEKNAELSPQRQMQFRIGINLGDVIVEGERLYGDGVNIAARLESLAIPGGICISGTVYDQVENKLALNYEYQGEQTVKNIAKPVRTYRVVIEEAEKHTAEDSVNQKARESANQKAKVKNQKSKITDLQSLTLDLQAEAEACFLKAIDIAQRQQAKSLELRATMSLAKLWRQQGKRHEAHRLLSEIYGWFTEGFGTKDLQDAKALLNELAEGEQ